MAKYLQENTKGINSFHIRLIGFASMLWYFLSMSGIEKLSNDAIAECMQWFSCTIFAFLLVEGINNTSNRLLYIRRFLVFTVLTEPAYDLYTSGKPWNTDKQSYMLTLFLCLTAMMICDYLKRRFNNTVLDIAAILLLSFWAVKIGNKLGCEFCSYGILLGMVFYASHDLTYKKLFEAVCMAFAVISIKTDGIISLTFNKLQYSLPITVFSVFALIITWFYNKKRGPNSIAVKIVFYLIYPLMLLAFFFANKYLNI